MPGTWAGRAGLSLGGLLDGQGLCHTHLGLSGWRVGWAGPEASCRHARHAKRRPEAGLKTGLGLLDDLGAREQEVKAWLAWAELLGQPD